MKYKHGIVFRFNCSSLMKVIVELKYVENITYELLGFSINCKEKMVQVTICHKFNFYTSCLVFVNILFSNISFHVCSFWQNKL